MTTISAGDAEVALRTFPRRWGSLFGGLDPDDPEAAAIVDHPGPEGRSAVDCAQQAGDRLADGRRALREAVGTGGADPTTPTGRSLEGALRRIDQDAPALADAVRQLSLTDLDARAGSGTVRTLVSDTVAEVADLLREAGDAVAAGRAAVR